MPTPKETASKIAADFDSLMGNYRRMTKMLLDGLAPGVPQERRNELRKLFTPFTKEAPGKKDAHMERGGDPLE